MQTAQTNGTPARPDSNASDHTMTANDPSESPYFLQNTEAIGLVPDSQRIDHLSLEEKDDEDIYRGEQAAPPRSPSLTSVSSSTSSSSSASSVFGGRLGAISAVVEHAISTWARAWASSSSLSASTSSSTPSIVTITRSQMSRRRRRRLSLADIQNQRSEREIAARIRAREESRYTPRAFDLYVPDVPESGRSARVVGASQGNFIHTDSLPLIVTRLGAALKDKGRARRGRSEPTSPEPPPAHPPILHHDYMMPEEPAESASASADHDAHIRRRMRKGKRRAGTTQTTAHMGQVSTSVSDADDVQKAWWLDVSSPTWEDMRAIGKLLHLHPLTLEDILQQDPREKLELFPKLGYYFVVFRAIESQKTRERLRALRSVRDGTVPSSMDEGIVGDVYVYMVVFREGICSFHFADIGEHVDHVRNKILKLSESINMTSDWIAHGIMDSIVDSFFPFLQEIEKEVDEIERLVVSDHLERVPNIEPAVPRVEMRRTHSLEQVVPHDLVDEDEKTSSATLAEKVPQPVKSMQRRTQFALPAGWSLHFRRLKRTLRETFAHFRVVFKHTPTLTTANTIYRMARTRRLVTSLARFLAHKSEVVAQLQKRLLTVGEWGLGHGTDHDQDVFVYMGDVQDHILTLQQSLAHYERVLSQSHPTYLSGLRLSLSKAQSGTDTALVTLTTVSLGVLCVQTLIGSVSMNTNVPQNASPGDNFTVFGVIIALSVVITVVYGFFVRLWWVWAKQKRRAKHLL